MSLRHGKSSFPDSIRLTLRISESSAIIAITNEKLDIPDYADHFVYGVEGPEILIQMILNGRCAEPTRI